MFLSPEELTDYSGLFLSCSLVPSRTIVSLAGEGLFCLRFTLDPCSLGSRSTFRPRISCSLGSDPFMSPPPPPTQGTTSFLFPGLLAVFDTPAPLQRVASLPTPSVFPVHAYQSLLRPLPLREGVTQFFLPFESLMSSKKIYEVLTLPNCSFPNPPRAFGVTGLYSG